jgi:hypothetical protein
MKMFLVILSAFLLLSLVSVNASSLPTHWWKFKEGSGDLIADEVSPVVCSRVNFNDSWIVGVQDYALRYDGIDDWVNCTNDVLLNLPDDAWTIKVWVRAKVPLGSCIDGSTIYHKAIPPAPVAPPSIGYWLYLHDTCQPEFDLSDGFGGFFSLFNPASPNVMDGNWHQIVVLRNIQHWEMWIDKVLVSSANFPPPVGSLNNPMDLSVGSIDGLGLFFDGDIDELEMFHYALSPPEIAMNYDMFGYEGEYIIIQENTTYNFGSGNYEFSDPLNNGWSVALNGSNIAVICNDTVFEFNGVNGTNSLSNGVDAMTAYTNWDTEYNNITIRGCTFKDFFNGIHSANVNGAVFEDNKFYNNWENGIKIESWRCQMESNGSWIDITNWYSDPVTYDCNKGFGYYTLTDNYFEGQPIWERVTGDAQGFNRGKGIYLFGIEGGVVKDNYFAGNFTVDHLRMEEDSNLLIDNNTFKGGGWFIIWEYGGRNWWAKNNTFSNNKFMFTNANQYTGESGSIALGISDRSRDFIIENNYIQNIGEGILEGATWNTSTSESRNNILRNNIVYNTIYAFDLEYGNNSILINNTAYNDDGFCRITRTGVIICLNDSVYYPSGILFYYSNNNYLEKNDISGYNGYWDMWIENSYNNTGCGNIYDVGNVTLLGGVIPSDNNISTLSCHPTPPTPSGNVNETLSDVGQGVGNLLLNMASPLAIFIILLAIGSMVGFFIASIGKGIGGKV